MPRTLSDEPKLLKPILPNYFTNIIYLSVSTWLVPSCAVNTFNPTFIR